MKKIILKLIYISFFLLGSCLEGSNQWDYDENYTMALIFNAMYRDGGHITDSVDAIQVYKLKDKKNHVLPLNILRRQPLLVELRTKEGILNFLESFQKLSDHGQDMGGCTYVSAEQVFHIIAYDSRLMRLGYIRYYLCSIKGEKYGAIIPLVDEGVFYNIRPPELFLENQ